MQNRETSPGTSGHNEAVPAHVDGLVIGSVASVNELGIPRVDYSGNGSPEPREARTTAVLNQEHVGRRVVLAFEGGRTDSPIVLGVVHDPLVELITANDKPAPDAVVDDERVVLTAEKEIVLKCGDASITLRKDGKVLIRGAHLLSRSSGPNRVKGASVQIN